ncbi:helix-turn-helix domain-containing protein [Mitsuaria sp. 7]|uniref:helix-turn-helix domain-containing protein n=1 Tax=Mitsuaria sp. 7 TaxID=1658665 RepID=UPI0007DE0EBC|nr:helix-turn-helix domain-containing protein [Mitsuaria sp. 7]ANH70991.1 hypothetical protein ABE85_26060 [Mitsuaria sp. 7]
MRTLLNDDEVEQGIGETIRALRLQLNLDQATVAERSGVSVRALRNLEKGAGSTVRTLLVVMRVLGRESWFDGMAPMPTINPLNLPRRNKQRERATATSVRQAQERARKSAFVANRLAQIK